LTVGDTARPRDWFGEPGDHTVFQWHYEAFELPAGAVALARSAACPHQAFALGPHLAMQFHVELDAEKLARWSTDDGRRYLDALAQHASVQTGAAMRQGAGLHLARQQALAARIYRRWWSAAGQR
jgi:GMP synthase-like glutamine amidotransferase